MRAVNWCFSVKNRAFKKLAEFILKKAKAEKFFHMFLHRESLPQMDELNSVLFTQMQNAVLPTAACIQTFFSNPSVAFFDVFDKDYKGEPIV